MQPTTKFPSKSARRKRFLMAAACLATLATVNPTLVTPVTAGAPQCGCSEGCDGGCGSGHGPIYQTLDTVAGGIEKLLFFSLKHRGRSGGCDDMSCDDGCDAMTMGDMMMYEDAGLPTHVHAVPSLPPQSMPSRVIPSVPAPRLASPAMGSPRTAPPVSPSAPTVVSQPHLAPVRQPAVNFPQPVRSSDGDDATGSGLPPERGGDDSLFDNLQDPFRDDSAQLNAPSGGSRPTHSTRPASYRTSTRR